VLLLLVLQETGTYTVGASWSEVLTIVNVSSDCD